MKRLRPRPIALLTDFGTRDWYVATLKGVLLSRCPGAQLVDMTHEIPPQDVVAGAFTLAAAAPWFPQGTVFLAVVDPGVGSNRALLAAHANGRYFVGPDNGLLTLSVGQARARSIVQLTNHRYWLKEISGTFQGRDIMAPVAAYLACGGSLHRLGGNTQRLTHLALPTVERRGRVLQGSVIHIDAFGNLITNFSHKLLPRNGDMTGVTFRYRDRDIRVVSSYANGQVNELVAVVGSLGFVELAVREASAAWTYHAKRGDRVEFTMKPLRKT